MARRPSRRPDVAVPIARPTTSTPPARPTPVDPSDPVAVIRSWVTAPPWRPLVNSRPSDWVALLGLPLAAMAVLVTGCAAGGLLYALLDTMHAAARR